MHFFQPLSSTAALSFSPCGRFRRHASSETLRGTATAALSHLLGHDILGGECYQDRHNDASRSRSSCSSRGAGPHTNKSNKSGGQRSENLAPGERRGGRVRQVDGGEHAAGWITSRVMCELGAPEAVARGLSAEGTSAVSRKAFLGIFNLVLWASRNSRGGAGGTGGRGWADCGQEYGHGLPAAGGGGGPHASLRRAVECMLDSPQLLPRLLRVAEHGEGAVLRAKGFLALRLTLEVASPAFLLKACRSRLLPLLARSIGGLAPRWTSRGPVTAAATAATATAATAASAATAAAATTAAAVAVPELSPPQQYLFECSTKLADWLCAVPERAASRLNAELREPCAADMGALDPTRPGRHVLQQQQQQQQYRQDGRGNSSSSGSGSGGGDCSRRVASRLLHHPAAADVGSLETSLAMFPAVVHLVNSPLLRGRAVTAAFVSDLAACLALSCPIAAGAAGQATAGAGARGSGSKGSSSGGGAVSAPAVDHGTTGSVVLAAILPTVETLAQQAELVLVPHRWAVSTELVPVLCRLLRSPSGDTRALVVAIFRVLLPPLVRRQSRASSTPQGCPDRSAAASTAELSPENTVRSAFATHVLPLSADLLRDYAPIPQYTIRLLLDVGREWGGLGTALLVAGGESALYALLDRLPRPVSGPLPSPTPRGQGSSPLPPFRRQAKTLHYSGPESAGEDAMTALDPALAVLFTLLVERDQAEAGRNGREGTGGASREGSESGRGWVRGGQGSGDRGGRRGDYGGDTGNSIFVKLLHLELPGRTAAAIAAAVEAGVPETTDGLLGLAVALLDASVRRKAATARDTEAVRGEAVTWEERQLEPLLTAVPAVVWGLKLFCVDGVLAKNRREQEPPQAPTRRRDGRGGAEGAVGVLVVDEAVRSGVADSATLFLEACFEVRECWVVWVSAVSAMLVLFVLLARIPFGLVWFEAVRVISTLGTAAFYALSELGVRGFFRHSHLRAV